MGTLLIESHYLPTINYFQQFSRYKTIFLEGKENFQKQSYRNRTYILGANNIECLVVPIKKKNSKLISDIEIEYAESWHKKHIRAILSAYSHAPFFEYYSDEIIACIEKKHHYLFDLNIELIQILTHFLDVEHTISITESYSKNINPNIFDARNVFIKRGEKNLPTEKTSAYSYQQVFGKEFAPNLSVIDLLFNKGPESLSIIQSTLDNNI